MMTLVQQDFTITMELEAGGLPLNLTVITHGAVYWFIFMTIYSAPTVINRQEQVSGV